MILITVKAAPMREYLKSRVTSVKHAIRGIGTLVSTQPHARIHLLATIVVVLFGFVMHLRRWEWVAVLLCIGIVWVAEAMNTALEFLADEVSVEHRERIRNAKDTAAGGVLISAIISAITAGLIFWNHIQ